MSDKKLLIVSFVFPPDKGIGGRRWSKLSKQLAENGNKVFVITATPDADGQYSVGMMDGVNVIRVKSPYPSILRYMGKMNLWHKIKYKLYKKYYDISKKGNIYDVSIGWDKNLIPAIAMLIKEENIKNIIVTAPPYRHMYYVSQLKLIYPALNIILDFRDPWTELKSFKSMFNIDTDERLAVETKLEEEALKHADHIVAVSEERARLFDKLVPDPKKAVPITNGADLRDYDFLSSETLTKNNYFSIVHAGTLNPGYLKTIIALVDFINRNKDALLKSKVKFEFCGHVNPQMLSVLKQAPEEIVICHGLLPQQEAIRILNRADAGLIIIKEGYENIHFITKMYEYMALKKKMIYFGPLNDSLSKLLSSKNIGVTFQPDKLEDLLPWLLEQDKFNSLSYANFDMTPYLFTTLAKQVEELLV